jgi:XisI protein
LLLSKNEVLKKHISKDNIVLGMQEPELRAFSGYAVA